MLYAWFRTLHGILAWLLFAVVIGHLSAALLHAWIYRDGVFSSMALGPSSKKKKLISLLESFRLNDELMVRYRVYLKHINKLADITT